MKALPHTRSCFVCGESNAAGLNLRFDTDGANVRARFVPKREHIGFKGVVHGGIIAAVLDEIMVWAGFVRTGRFAFCAEIRVRFVKPVRPGDDTIATGALVADRRGRIFNLKADLRNPAGDILASAEGKYLPIDESEVAGMMDDVVEAPG